MRNILKTVLFCFVVTGCSGYNEKWPELNAPLPDERDRERVIAAPARPIVPKSVTESETPDFADWKKSRVSLVKSIESIWQRLGEKVDNFAAENKEQDDMEDRFIAWSDMQLTLSRLSAELEYLRELAGYRAVTSQNTEKEYRDDKANLEKVVEDYDKKLKAVTEKVESLKPAKGQ